MLDLEELSKLRFGMSRVPEVGGQPGMYEEKWSQWFLERSFFRDFVYRNPRGRKKGQELADAVVLFDDVALMVQVKAQRGRHEPMAWATEALLKAFKQLAETHKSLVEGHIRKLENDYFGEMEFRPESYPNQIGIIILAHQSTSYVAAELAPEILTAKFPVNVFSLDDFAMVASRFDTAGDLITFLEFRGDIATKEALLVQDEIGNIERIIPHVEDSLRNHMPATPPEILRKTVRAFQEVALGRLLESPDWKYGLSIDDMIAHAHDVDPDLPWNRSGQRAAIGVAEFLGWLTRGRRITLGKKIVSMCEAAKDTKAHFFPHIQPSRGTACVFLATAQSRPKRIKFLEFLVQYAQMKHGVPRCLGVATEPIGSGRSYDFLLRSKPPRPELLEKLRTFDDPFGAEEPL
jgi:hypothetical protein